jgi:hypothetical protein
MPYADPARQREFQARWIAQRRAEWFAGKTCSDCGTPDDLHLDHRDPKLKVSHRIWSWSRARREVELAKCVARCEPCHLIKTRAGGETITAAVVDPELVEEIRSRYAAGGITQTALGKQYGIGQQAISKIVLGQRWSACPDSTTDRAVAS